ncbi:MAG: methyltransferase domain-containing protein [Desulfobacteraceae bacterium]|nr:methyltransferase domain-containing protein [Desulfobacteraceae bacterium]
MSDAKNNEDLLKQHYGRPDLAQTLFEALAQAGRKISSYKDTAAFDEFHMRGREATLELARLAGLRPGQRVLDLGCGLGGPSRLLAAEFGCQVQGIDLMAEFIQVATRLTQMVGLEEKVSFQQGNMLELPYDDGAFDVAWSQHTFMNIEDKLRLAAQIQRVLKVDGMLAMYEIFRGQAPPIHYPVQWAGDASTNFLISLEEMLLLLQDAGFKTVHQQDVTQACCQWFEALIHQMQNRPRQSPPIGLNLVIGPGAAEKARNTGRNLRENRIQVAYLVLTRT